MPRKRVSDDLDHVVDEPTATKRAKKAPPKPTPIPPFTPIQIDNNLTYGLGRLPQHISRTPYDIFSLFFSPAILQRIVDHTNEYAAHQLEEQDKPFAREWFPTTMKELRAYLAVNIYMGVHHESAISDFWNTKNTGPLHPQITKHIALKRWQQIDRFLRVSKPQCEHPTVFDKLEELSEHLREAFKLPSFVQGSVR